MRRKLKVTITRIRRARVTGEIETVVSADGTDGTLIGLPRSIATVSESQNLDIQACLDSLLKLSERGSNKT